MADWIAKATKNKGAYGHHSKAVQERDAKGSGLKAKRARLALTLESLHRRAKEKLYPK